MSHCQPSKASLLAVREFRTQGKNAANKAMDGYVQNLLHVMEPEAHQSDRSGVTFNSLRKNLAWWAVTQRTSKTTKLPKLGDGCLLGGRCLPGTIRYLNSSFATRFYRHYNQCLQYSNGLSMQG